MILSRAAGRRTAEANDTDVVHVVDNGEDDHGRILKLNRRNT